MIYLLQGTVEKLGGLDQLVLNHIILLNLWHWEGSKDNLTLIDKVLKVNFQSYVYLASHALPHLELSSGSIIVVSSFAGKLFLSSIQSKHYHDVNPLCQMEPFNFEISELQVSNGKICKGR